MNDISDMKAMTNLIDSLQERCKEFDGKLEKMSEEKEHATKEHEKILQTVSNLRRDLYKEYDRNISLQSRLDQLEQNQRENNVRVMGFPEQDDDINIKTQLVQLVGAKEELAVHISSTLRMGKKKINKPRDLIVTLSLNRNATFWKLPFFWRRVYTSESGVIHHFDNAHGNNLPKNPFQN